MHKIKIQDCNFHCSYNKTNLLINTRFYAEISLEIFTITNENFFYKKLLPSTLYDLLTLMSL